MDKVKQKRLETVITRLQKTTYQILKEFGNPSPPGFLEKGFHILEEIKEFKKLAEGKGI